MKPSFALILDLDGIILLRRVADGWHIIGRADPASEDLPEDLAHLRRTATELSNGRFATKLVIPDSQILYTELDIPSAGDAVTDGAVRKALVGVTPYDVDDINFDWVSSGDGTVKVAAVAKLTLSEAEAFAIDHRFNPVSFVGRPETDTFSREPFFGETLAAKDFLGAVGKVEQDQTILAYTEMPELPDVAPAAIAGDEQTTPDEQEPERPQEEAPTAPEVVAAPSFSTRRAAASEPAAVTSPVLDEAIGSISVEDVLVEYPASRLTPVRAPEDEPAAQSGPVLTSPQARTETSRSDMKVFGSGAKEAEERRSRQNSRYKVIAVLAFLAVVVAGAIAYPFIRPAEEAALPTDTGVTETVSEAFPTEEAASNVTSRETGQGDEAPLVGIDAVQSLADLPQIEERAVPSVRTDETVGTTQIASLPEIQGQDAPSQAMAPPTAEELAEFAEEIPDEVTGPAEVEILDVAMDGIVSVAPVVPEVPALDRVDNLYIASIDRDIISHDAVALPAATSFAADTSLGFVASPAAPGTTYDRDEQGFIQATPTGAVTPDGVRIFSGKPENLPLLRPGTQVLAEAVDPGIRPLARPTGLVETNERSRFGGRSLAELGQVKPIARPVSAQEELTSQDEALVLDVSRRPLARPSQIAKAVERALASANASSAPAPVQTASAPPSSLPTDASVARQATIPNAIRLSDINLIGVYGTSNDRRALVRLKGGRYVKVKVGDRLDGGKVSAIGATQLIYVKKGRSVALDLVQG